MVDGNSIADSIKHRAKAKGIDALESMRRYAMERLIVRLHTADDGDRTVLKGGMLWWLTESLRGHARPTTDIDIHFHAPEEHGAVMALLEAAGAVVLDDGCRFEFHSPRTLEHTGEHEGLRVKTRAYIGSKYVDFHIDVGFGGRRPEGIVPTEFRSMHPKMPGGSMLMVPIEYVAAEKLHAIVKLGMKNTRLKDYNDLAVISGMDVASGRLAEAVAATFEDRSTEIPDILTEGFTAEYAARYSEDWGGWLVASRRAGKLPDDFGLVVETVAQLAQETFLVAKELSAGRPVLPS